MKEIELKFRVNNVVELLNKIDGPFKASYVFDEVFNNGNQRIRQRTNHDGNINKVEWEMTTRIKDDKIKKVIEKKMTSMLPGFVKKNSYDKIRFAINYNKCFVTVDFYSFGVFCEIEGSEKQIKLTAKKLGFNLQDNIKEDVDTLFCQWYKKFSKKEPPLHWGFVQNIK